MEDSMPVIWSVLVMALPSMVSVSRLTGGMAIAEARRSVVREDGRCIVVRLQSEWIVETLRLSKLIERS